MTPTNHATNGIVRYFKDHDGTRVTVTIKVEAPYYKDYAKWSTYYQESPIAFDMERIRD
jgi:hypothetical protein